MSEAEYINELCEICSKLLSIVEAQSEALAQVGAVVAEEERAEAESRCRAALGDTAQSDGR